MDKKEKAPFVPAERRETVRREIIAFLEGKTLSAKEISSGVGVSEKEVYEHLQHVRRSLGLKSSHLVVTPSECKKCGFVFRKRERLRKPGKCPICKGEAIDEPLFSLSSRA